ncbi:hypothetical protein SAMN05216227_10408 [Pseudorhodobacter antarcticus]|uniref:Tellurium resistance protein n=1 Tax=Pseudorhodobacter antarcticus TaxID=1077947 RepID=A0A1H8L9Z5_9RHOB|nr:TrgA family protein [Pseudorhodobacter antarcticus]SEO01972.1 hypothetical protein SAMN05216227_10408 [Pseudorhodobacter antarcticus]
MPTLSKLIAAVIFAATAYFAGEAFKLGLPEGTQFGLYSIMCPIIGLICGWRIMGAVTGHGYSAALGSGVKTSVAVVVWALLIFSTILMVRKAFKQRYDGALEAIVDIFALAVENGALVFTQPVLVALVGGAVAGGLASEWAKRRWD